MILGHTNIIHTVFYCCKHTHRRIISEDVNYCHFPLFYRIEVMKFLYIKCFRFSIIKTASLWLILSVAWKAHFVISAHLFSQKSWHFYISQRLFFSLLAKRHICKVFHLGWYNGWKSPKILGHVSVITQYLAQRSCKDNDQTIYKIQHY